MPFFSFAFFFSPFIFFFFFFFFFLFSFSFSFSFLFLFCVFCVSFLYFFFFPFSPFLILVWIFPRLNPKKALLLPSLAQKKNKYNQASNTRETLFSNPFILDLEQAFKCSFFLQSFSFWIFGLAKKNGVCWSFRV